MRGSSPRLLLKPRTHKEVCLMYRAWMTVGLMLLTFPSSTTAQDAIASARFAWPYSISADATVMGWDLNVII